jgi:hypothetical protein
LDKSMPQPVDVYAWRNAIMSENGPTNPLARLVLIAVSLHMDNTSGSGAWPAQTSIAKRAGVSLRSVKRHLEFAHRRGWIELTKVQVQGKRWRRNEYAACVPDAVYESLPERPWESDPTWRRSATVAPSQHPTDTRAAPDKVPTAIRQGANGARQGANDDIHKVPELGLLTLPLNSSKNSSGEGALASKRTARLSDSDLKAKIRKYRSIGFGDGEIMKALAQFSVTIEEVRRWRKEA